VIQIFFKDTHKNPNEQDFRYSSCFFLSGSKGETFSCPFFMLIFVMLASASARARLYCGGLSGRRILFCESFSKAAGAPGALFLRVPQSDGASWVIPCGGVRVVKELECGMRKPKNHKNR
jgi:hypothetical protein